VKARQASSGTFQECPPSTEQFTAWELPLAGMWALILNSGKGLVLFVDFFIFFYLKFL